MGWAERMADKQVRDARRMALHDDLVAALEVAHDCLLDYPVGFEAVLQQARDVLKRAKEADNVS